MKLGEVFRYELAYHLRSPSTWLYPAILFGLGFVIIASIASENDPVDANAPLRLAEGILILGSLFGLVISAALFADAAVRDVQTGMDPLVFTSPLRKVEYLGGRFLAALAVNAMILVAIPLGQAAAILGPNVDAAAFGPFRAGAYIQPYLLFVLPHLILAGAILFTMGVLSRQVIPVYLAAIGIFIAYLSTMSSLEWIDNPLLTVLTDPIGFRVVEERTGNWTPAERNTRLIGVPAGLVWNRVAWLAIAVAVLALLHRRFRFAHPDVGGGGPKVDQPIAAPGSRRALSVAVPRLAGTFGRRTHVRQTLGIASHAFGEMVRGRTFIAALLLMFALTLLFGWEVGRSVFDTSTWPLTILVTERLMETPLVPITFLFIAVYAGELIWKERDSRMAEIADATPVPEWAALLGRFLALVPILAILQAPMMVGGILIQAVQGYHNFEVGLYIRIIYGMLLPEIVLLAALAMAIHVVVNHKYVGHVLVLGACVLPIAARELGFIRHNLLLYGKDPGWTYSDMNGFGEFIGPFAWFKLYWAAWALLLGVVAVLFWVRGRESGPRRRLGLARARLTGPVLRTAGMGLGLILVLGGFVFYNTNVLNEYLTSDEAGLPQAEYEKRYGRFEDAPQPTIAGVQLHIEIHPEDPAVDLRGTYRLINRTDAPIDSVHVMFIEPGIDARSISFDRPSEPVVVDDETRYRIYALGRSLEPGDSLQLAFDVSFRPRGFKNSGIQTDVVGNGASFNRSWLPIIGYQPGQELPEEEARRRFGLQPHPPSPGPDDWKARQYRWSLRNEDLLHIDAVVGTAADQIAVAPGVLRRSWTENGRRYFHYVTESPTLFGATVVSAEYAVVEDRWNDVALRVLHHPAHAWNLDRMVRAMKASLEYFTREFGPYRGRQLSIFELPRYGGFGSALMHAMTFTEDAFFSRVKDGEIDQPFYGTAHEVAHQWWGGQVRGAPVRGHGLLSESLANYSAMMVTEKTFGLEVARRVYDFHMGHYLAGRANQSREVPVLDVEDQAYVAYRRGAVALYTLRLMVGEAAVNSALRRYLEKFRDAGPPYPTSRDLYAELRTVTPDSLRPLLSDLFETVTLWDVKAERATFELTEAGEYRVRLDVVARKVRADSVGNETEVPMDDLVEIGVFAPGAADAPRSDGPPGEPLYLERHRIRSGKQTISVTVPREPARAGIDPWRWLIDRGRDDNVVAVGSGAAQSPPRAP